MPTSEDDFDAVRREPDPIKRGRRATELLATYQQRATELARLRRAAIEEARDQVGGSYSEMAKAFGLTKGRITQIRSSAPPRERAFFGVGPVTVAIPGREFPGRRELVIATEDDYTANVMIAELNRLSFTAERFRLHPSEPWSPDGDAVVICGPESAPVGAALLDADPVLAFQRDGDGVWFIERRDTGERFYSPMDRDRAAEGDVAYLARHQDGDRVIVHIAGIHALGSIAAAMYLTTALDELYRESGEASFSMVVAGTFHEQKPSGIEVLVSPERWAS